MNYSYNPNYILSTEMIRANYIYDSLWPELDGAKFDRWLAAHDAEIRADEREKAAQRIVDAFLYYYGSSQAPAWLLAAVRGGEQV